MIVEPNAVEGRTGDTVHLLVNGYDGSSETMSINSSIRQEKLHYIDNKKSRTFSAASRLKLPAREKQNRPGSKVKILTEKNLVKYREQQGDVKNSKSTPTTPTHTRPTPYAKP